MTNNKILKGINFPGLEGTYYVPEAKAVKDENGYIEIQSYISDTVEVENLDTTLTKEGYAADAKAVGDALQNKVSVVEGSRLMTQEEANKLAKLVIDEDGNAGSTDIINVGNAEGILAITHGGTGNTTGYIQTGAKAGSSIGSYATAEGFKTTASRQGAHAEGQETTASGLTSHAEGLNTTASEQSAHAEGWLTTAAGQASHAEGYLTQANEDSSHAEGLQTIASSRWQHVQGKYNIEDVSSTYAHIVGNGSSTTRSNAHTLDWDGNAWFAGAIEAKNISNPNLLDNWYFAEAVNQRGAESYWEEGFSIDRWKFSLWHSSGAYVFPTNSDVTLHNETATGTPCSCYIEQTLENPKYLAGKTVTFSAKLRTTTSVSGKPILCIYTDNSVFKSDYLKTSDGGKIVTLTATLPTNITTLAVGIGAFANYAGSGNFNLAIESVKLEVGAVSTLANDVPPKYSEQLRECQRYYIRWQNSEKLQVFTGGASGTTVYAAVQLPVAMRGTNAPKITYSGIDIYPFVSNGAIAAKSCGGNMVGSRNNIVLWATYDKTSDCPAQTPATIRIGAGGYIDLSCEI